MADSKNYFSRNLLSVLVLLIAMWVYNVYALSFPSTTPSWEVPWGKLTSDISALNQKIDKMLAWCPAGSYIGSFKASWVANCFPLPVVSSSSCMDWIKNWTETWVDCWWTCAKACSVLISWIARHSTSCASITANGTYIWNINCWWWDTVSAPCKLDFIAQKLGYKSGKLISEVWSWNIPSNASCWWEYGTYFSVELSK